MPLAAALICSPQGGKFIAMKKWLKSLAVFIVIASIAYLLTAQEASAISVELAKKCRALAIKAHPAPKVGTKATGADKAQREYFQSCVAKNGKMEN
jgi:hypothetical protein